MDVVEIIYTKYTKIQYFGKCICILGRILCSLSGPGFAPSVVLYFYTQHSILKPAKLLMPQGPRF